jgi:hypothetical protein
MIRRTEFDFNRRQQHRSFLENITIEKLGAASRQCEKAAPAEITRSFPCQSAARGG